MNELPLIERRPIPSIPEAMADLNPRLAQVLALRGITHPDQLDLGLSRLLAPADLPGIEVAAERIAAAVQADEPILIVGDFDADGATATTLCVRALRAFGTTRVAYTLPDRQRHGYGLSPALLRDWLDEAAEPPRLLITVDNGVAAHAGVAAAQAMGTEVVVTDHHLPGTELPPATAIVNPNLAGSAFGSPSLAGVGVAFYVLAAVRDALTRADWFTDSRPRPNLAQWLDLVAVGTVADVVPLDDNNRRLVAQGLARIRAGQCLPGISALFAVAGKDPRQAASTDLGFVVGPRLNAAGRLEDMRLGVACLLADDPAEARHRAIELDRINQERRAVEQEMLASLGPDARSDALSLADLPRPVNPADWVRYDVGFHQGVIGIVAGRLKERWQRPVFVFAPEDPEAGDAPDALIKGSGRSMPGVHLRDVLVAMATAEPELMRAFGGHAMAAGVSIERRQLDRFRGLFAGEMAKFADRLPERLVIPSDGGLGPGELTVDFAETLRDCTPWGTDCPEPVFDNRFEVLDRVPMSGGKHWRLTLRLRDPDRPEPSAGASYTAVWFGIGDRLPANRYLHLAYRLNINHFRGRQSLQLMVVGGLVA
ncbi:single-stranded-DNA-specific exonuclease RecJ [Halothiobacillus diazotrophicus]|uniref:Single-stranded-DNA-specific exonuclease RecJ n=1 Tax=Halothiobacillus diazotrophicus TaxID=1860122 RepID=A0A191ZJ94_9GAMM|nr:single-stranded-DNA-specific exonuclease RecJ [Halothiobacillus diazotrophicus]ANJ67913.1 single-stranded-DNA-specific exonuclease RecJ [Halothiobacillus diazotrophicus]